MRMSTKGRLAVNALLDLALREGAGPVALASIADRQQVSLSYLEQMFSRLRRQGIVESTRGPGGGYTLGRPAAEVSVADIVSCVDDPADVAQRAGLDDVLSKALWQELDAVMLKHMATISLQSLVDAQVAAGVKVEPRSAPRRLPLAVVAATRLPLRCNAPNSVFALGASLN